MRQPAEISRGESTGGGQEARNVGVALGNRATWELTQGKGYHGNFI